MVEMLICIYWTGNEYNWNNMEIDLTYFYTFNLPISSKAHIKTSGAIYGFVPDILQASPSGGNLVAILKSVKCACPEL